MAIPQRHSDPYRPRNGRSGADGRPPQRSRQTTGRVPSVLMRLYETIRRNVILRNVVMAFCLGVILYFVVNLFLGIYTRHGQKFIVPQMIGHSFEEAVAMAEKGDLRLEVIDSLYMPKQRPGQILDQSPKPGMGVKKGRRVFLTVNAFRPRTDVIPYVTGYSLRQAKNMLETKGFEIERLVYKSDMATNNVLDELYKGKAITREARVKAELGSSITLVVGVNHSSPLPRIPKVIGLTLREAKSRLWEAGINVGRVRYDSNVKEDDYENARVYRQEPNQQSRIDYGGQVSLWLTRDGQKISTSSRSSDEATRRTVEVDEEEDEAAGQEAVEQE